MRKVLGFTLALALALSIGAGHGNAGFRKQKGKKLPRGKVPMEKCMAAATRVISGQVAIVEFKSQDGYPVYEFEIKAKDGTLWNVEVNAKTGHVVEIEKQVKPEDPVFRAQAKITQKQAEVLALEFMPGKVDRREYIIEPDGVAVYEFDIQSVYGCEFKVEVEAETGKIHRINPVYWEIGDLE